MENSILTSTKKILGVAEDYTAFDLDIITHINSAFTVVNQLGVGPTSTFVITDSAAKWSDLEVSNQQLGMLRTYIFLKVRMLFDPPTTSFHIEALSKQIEEHEARLNYSREYFELIEEV